MPCFMSSMNIACEPIGASSAGRIVAPSGSAYSGDAPVSGGVAGNCPPIIGRFQPCVPPMDASGACSAGNGCGGGPVFGQLSGGIIWAGEGTFAFFGGGGYRGGGGRGAMPDMPGIEGSASIEVMVPRPPYGGSAAMPPTPPGIGGSGSGAGIDSSELCPCVTAPPGGSGPNWRPPLGYRDVWCASFWRCSLMMSISRVE
mmetsp:Transcript_2614/g.6758  ORF Transcript_2614/g.6758 Transcript_2614/m.6758 type:complete len:200 (+) Transcript_2614:1-600(+)